MISTASGRSQKRRPRIFYGWWIVAISAIVDAMKQGSFNRGVTIYVLPVQEQLGISRASVAFADTVGRLVGGIEGPVSGYLIDRLGPSWMIALGAVLSGLGFILLAFSHSYLYFMAVFVFMSLGFRGGYNNATMAAVNQWFRRKKSLAMALVTTGHGLGGVVFVPLVAALVLGVGWRTAAFVSGVVIIAVLVPLAVFVRRSPESMGLVPDGDTRPRVPVLHQPARRERDGGNPGNPGAAVAAAPAGRSAADADFTASEGLKSLSYWMLVLALGLRNTVHGGVAFHLVPMMVWAGTSEAKGAFLIAVLSFGAIVFNPLLGWMGDTLSKRRISALAMAVGALSMVMLLARNGEIWYLAIFVLLLALAESANPLASAILGDYFGRKSFATLRGWQHLPDQVMSMSTPLWMGMIFDRTDSYSWALVPLAAMYGLAALCFWWLPRPRPPARLRRPAAVGATAP